MPAKHLITFLFLLLCSLQGRGQVYFDTLFDEGQLVETLTNVVGENDGYKFTMRSRDATVDTAAMVMVSLNLEGNEITRIPFTPSARTLTSGELVQVPSGSYVLFNSVGTAQSNSIRDCSSIRYDSNGNALWIQQYGEVLKDDICFYGLICNDGSYAIFGQSAESDLSEADMMLIKTDSIGNEIWIKYFGGNFFEGAGNSGLVQTPDSGFLLLGWTRSFGAGQRDFYLVKTDSVGNQEWQRTYGGSDMETGTCIIALSDGNYLLAGAQIIGGIDKGKLIKIDPDGTVIWQKEYLYPGCSASEINKVLELVDGSIIAAGVSDKSNEGNSGWLLKTDSEGTEIWQRKYNKNNNTDLFYSVLLANDEGFLLSGQARNTETNSQDAWLLKVDSVGCPYPNCTVGVDEVEKNKVVVDVWPNPASESLRFEVQSSRLENLTITATDMQGRTVLNYEPQTTNIELPVSDWPNGLYIFTITSGNERARVRVVVQH